LLEAKERENRRDHKGGRLPDVMREYSEEGSEYERQMADEMRRNRQRSNYEAQMDEDG